MPLKHPIFKHITDVVDRMGVEAYVVGGYVRDYYLRRPSSDIDVVVVGSGIAVAEELGKMLNTKVVVYKTYGVDHPPMFLALLVGCATLECSSPCVRLRTPPRYLASATLQFRRSYRQQP